jgi:hypothetical protein
MVVIGGLLSNTLLTLVVIPVIYSLSPMVGPQAGRHPARGSHSWPAARHRARHHPHGERRMRHGAEDGHRGDDHDGRRGLGHAQHHALHAGDPV